MGPLEAIVAAWSLDPDVFRGAASAAVARFGVLVVLAAGLALALGQSVALFAVGVPPRRFAASLLLQAALFAGGFLVWATSVWVLARYGVGRGVGWSEVVAATGLAHAPQLFGGFVLVPYLGAALGTVLHAWTLLAVLVATAATLDLTLPQAAALTLGGWLLAQLLQRTLGRPLHRWTERARRAVAGVDLGRPRGR